ncbi:MAG: hypothetical protein COW32_07835 [Candidatus Aquicultor secundus]|uniref:Peptidase M50 domain-containing protein n=1 Tax=Candidatus Aquicultor secundus TaxID=1973895 RepID=A0A2M7TAJ0_9ACTN|nr:site-2 protease family protein [Candidatus Aquicultor secundus]NCO66772.1 hypothetical protein [Solirubrobacter sp.]OIO87893.1 MAG: hypothetical protein AUK32_02755 [Candidatus Aquicultor secundus]PIU26663.1 MAG: hypothetical protein COT10_07485 [Candidatus Aquicultor secundus]PIW21857.1 MAG: hypothetical protein COW32_07835 [Candidatus Aquicultor secundus]PIX52192.1 MAG: hypothetical protein COZ51_05605 [Candidatus Aquicultor secundus]
MISVLSITPGPKSVLIFGSVLLHEMMHSIVAKSYGMTIEGIRLMLLGGVSQMTEEPRTPGIEFKNDREPGNSLSRYYDREKMFRKGVGAESTSAA